MDRLQLQRSLDAVEAAIKAVKSPNTTGTEVAQAIADIGDAVRLILLDLKQRSAAPNGSVAI